MADKNISCIGQAVRVWCVCAENVLESGWMGYRCSNLKGQAVIFTVALVKTSRTTGCNKADKLHIMHIIRLLKQVQQVCCQFLSKHHRDGQMFQSWQ